MSANHTMTSDRVEQEFTILNHLGMHARPAAEFVRCARRFKSRIEILVRGKRFSAQRLLEVLLAGLHAGSRFQLVAEGPDARSGKRRRRKPWRRKVTAVAGRTNVTRNVLAERAPRRQL